MYSTHHCIVGFYCRPRDPVEQEETYTDISEDEILSIISRYFISVGTKPKKFNSEYIYKTLAKELVRGWNKKYRSLFLKSAAIHIERNQHHKFDIKDYKSQIIKHTQRLIEEQKFNRECK